jgi:hypothetical protein
MFNDVPQKFSQVVPGRLEDSNAGNEEDLVAILRHPPMETRIRAIRTLQERSVLFEGAALDGQATPSHLVDFAACRSRQPKIELAEIIGLRQQALRRAVFDDASHRPIG